MPSRTKAPAPETEDTEMQDAPPSSSGAAAAAEASSLTGAERFLRPEEEHLIINGEDLETLKIRVLPGDTHTAASYEFLNENHTLGNALRHIIMKNPAVEFCGYSIPHPSDPKMNLRIQTYDDVNVHDVLEKGLNDLMDLCDVVLNKFEAARDTFTKTGT